MGGSDQSGSNVNPLALIFLVAMSVLILSSSRRRAVGAILATAAFIPLGQNIVIAGLHFYFLRVLILVGLTRLVMRHETADFRLAGMDKLFIGWVLIGLVCEIIRGASAEAFGAVYDTIGVYFMIRILTNGADDIVAHLRVLAFLGMAIGICMAFEVMTRRNPFFIFGGVPEFAGLRGGRFRCQGSFRHPILAGTFGATLFPLMIGLWRHARSGRWLAIGGVIGSVIITITSASSGPLLTFLAAIAGFCLWPLRRQMRFFRRGVVIVIICLAFVMKAPVWFLIGKISDLTGGGGYYRSFLIDQFIRHFTQWWMVGTSYTANWAGAGIVLPNNPNMVDITNHYVAQGVHAGLLGFGLFLAIIVGCFKVIGRAVVGATDPQVERLLLWAFGVCLAAHCTAFISVSYFDQIQVFWFWLLASITAVPVWAYQERESESKQNVTENSDESKNIGPAALSVKM
jgi:hypothetical protein